MWSLIYFPHQFHFQKNKMSKQFSVHWYQVLKRSLIKLVWRGKMFVSLSYCCFVRRSWTVRQFVVHWISLAKKNKTKRESDRAKGHLFLLTNKWQWPWCEPMIISCLFVSLSLVFLYKLMCISMNKLHNFVV